MGQSNVSDPGAQKREVGFILAVTGESPTTTAGHHRGDFTRHQGVCWRDMAASLLWLALPSTGGREVVGTLWDQGIRQEGLVETANIFIQLH